MLDRVQGMIEKLKYLNRKILEIDKKQSLLVEKEELLEKNLEQRVEKVDCFCRSDETIYRTMLQIVI